MDAEPILKYFCGACKKIRDHEEIHKLVLEGEGTNYYICNSCCDEIPLTTEEKINLQKV